MALMFGALCVGCSTFLILEGEGWFSLIPLVFYMCAPLSKED